MVRSVCGSSIRACSLFFVAIFCSSAHSQRPSCPVDWKIGPNKDKCFMHVASSLSWSRSEAQCQNLNGHLASLVSVEELNFVKSMCADATKGCWIGGRGYVSTLGLVWKWSDGISQWNDSVFAGESLLLNCTSILCHNTSRSAPCMLVTNGRVPLASENCSGIHAPICMLIKDTTCYHKLCHKDYIIILAAVSGLIIFTTLVVVVWLLAYRRSKKQRRSHKVSRSTSDTVSPLWKVFTCEELRSMTKNFNECSRLLGNAKISGTYSGVLPDGTRVAVKRLRRSNLQRKKEFYTEIGRVARLSHPNLVALKGCCYSHGDRYIIYEFMANGPLDRWLHHLPRGGRILDWAMRMRIVTTLAQGIEFLHDKVKPHLVHRDIRASNVLLDEEFRAHLLGVGLSKFVSWKVMHEKTKTAGTCGYLAPEFMYRNELTTKSDVYSFGVLLLEIVSGRSPAKAVESVGWQSIFEWATPLVQSRRYLELLDPNIPDFPEVGVVQKLMDLVYSCTQHVPSVRPRMSHLIHQLHQLRPRPVPTASE